MSPRRAEVNEQVRDAQQRKILDAAGKVFARRGLAATRISDIAAEAGVSHGLVHHYFGHKDALYTALAEQVMHSADALPRQALERDGTPWQRLRWFVETTLQGPRYAPELFFFAAEAATSEASPPAVRALFAERGDASVDLLAQLIAQGQRAGEMRAGDPKVIAAHYFALLQGLALQRLGGGGQGQDVDADIALGLFRPAGGQP